MNLHRRSNRLKLIFHKTVPIILFVSLVLLFCFTNLACGFSINFRSLLKYFNATEVYRPDPKDIAIVAVITKDTNIKSYEVALKSVECYAKAQGYSFILANDSQYGCTNNDKFFRRHCVTSKIISDYYAIMFIDADIGVVNPRKRIEEFLDDNIDITFYDRHFNFEIAMGSYLMRNTPYAKNFFKEFAEYESKLPNSVHGTDNGALHIFLAEKLFPTRKIEINLCQKAYNHSKNFDDLATYETCIRTILGSQTDYGKIRIMRKGTGWVRDAWLTSGVWSVERDFMLHGWKTKQLIRTPPGTIRAVSMNWSTWYNPFAGGITLEKCYPGNTTWSYNQQLIQKKQLVNDGLLEYEKQVASDKIKQMGTLFELVNRNIQ